MFVNVESYFQEVFEEISNIFNSGQRFKSCRQQFWLRLSLIELGLGTEGLNLGVRDGLNKRLLGKILVNSSSGLSSLLYNFSFFYNPFSNNFITTSSSLLLEFPVGGILRCVDCLERISNLPDKWF